MNESEIQRKRRENEEQATRNRARILGLPYLDTRSFENTVPLVPDVMTTAEMRQNFMIPLQKGDEDTPYRFMVTSQTPNSLLPEMRKRYSDEGLHIGFFLISNSAFQTFITRYDPPQEVHYDDRMRVDGLLHPVANLDRDRYRVIMGELSSRADVSTAANTPQSGHMQQDIYRDGSSHLLNIRVETVPTMYGQDAVLRLFNFDETLLNLNLLGLSEGEMSTVQEIISHPRGLVLMVGPTGSGKSTTLYSIINALNTTDRKIITLEDPIEYGITGISQIPINTTAGGSFAEGLRSVLRLDPDVVMVGEIRDGDTARTAIQASITGHLVLSSFHANSTAAAFARMIDLIGTNPIFASSIRLLIAQRLVRKLSASKEPYEPDAATVNYLQAALAGVEGVDLDHITLYKPVPTDDAPFGYQGRTVIMEQMVVSEDIQAYLRGDVSDVNTKAIEKSARAQGMLTLEQKGLLAALRGDTTLEEVSRVI